MVVNKARDLASIADAMSSKGTLQAARYKTDRDGMISSESYQAGTWQNVCCRQNVAEPGNGVMWSYNRQEVTNWLTSLAFGGSVMKYYTGEKDGWQESRRGWLCLLGD